MLNRNHALSVFDPFREIEKVEKSFFDDPWANFGRTFTDSFRTDVTDEGDHFKITADLPGFEKENITDWNTYAYLQSEGKTSFDTIFKFDIEMELQMGSDETNAVLPESEYNK